MAVQARQAHGEQAEGMPGGVGRHLGAREAQQKGRAAGRVVHMVAGRRQGIAKRDLGQGRGHRGLLIPLKPGTRPQES